MRMKIFTLFSEIEHSIRTEISKYSSPLVFLWQLFFPIYIVLLVNVTPIYLLFFSQRVVYLEFEEKKTIHLAFHFFSFFLLTTLSRHPFSSSPL